MLTKYTYNQSTVFYTWYIRTLKTLYPNFEKVKSEFSERYMRPFKTLHSNFEKGISEDMTLTRAMLKLF